MIVKSENFTPPALEESSSVPAEFCRISDLQRLFGIRRGTAYNLIREGKVRSVTLRRPGRATGVRLISVASVRDYLHVLLAEQTSEGRHA